MRSLWIALCLFLFAFAAFGQGDRGTITGTITDQQGAVIANAPVQAVNVGSGTVYQAASTETGNYTFAELPFGQYEVSVSVQKVHPAEPHGPGCPNLTCRYDARGRQCN
jgi:hypothetical protein